MIRITARKAFFNWKKDMYLRLCTQPHASISNAFYSHKLFYLTLAQESLASFSKDSKETSGISFTEALCLLRQLIEINGRRKKRINIQTSNWEENERDEIRRSSQLRTLLKLVVVNMT